MKNISKRKDGRYIIRKTIDGKQITKYAKTIEESKQILKKIKNKTINKKEETITLNKWIETWIETYKKPFVKEKSLKDIINIIKIIVNKFGKQNIKTINSEELQKYINTLKQNRTSERIITYTNAIFQKAEDCQIIIKNPFKAVTRPKKQIWRRTCYTFEEQYKLINHIKGKNIEHEIMCYLMTGCRPSEIPNKENFNFKDKFVIINGTKNENAKHREIPISNEFAKFIKNYTDNNRLLSYNEITKEYKNICNEIDIKSDLYKLRHTFATNLYTLGYDTKKISTYLGHSTISITLDIYTDIDKSITKDKLKALYGQFYNI